MNSTTAKRITTIAAFFTGTALLVFIWIALRWNAPPLRLSQRGTTVNVDVSTLGEYPSTVKRIRLSDEHGATIWELAAEGNVAQTHGFALTTGENPATIEADSGRYLVQVPRGSVFTLRKGTRYKVEVWGGSTRLAKTSAHFQID